MKKKLSELSVEIVKERVAPGPRGITMSTFRCATMKDVRAAIAAHRKKNPHNNEKTTVFYDEPGFIYDFRCCGICGEIIANI